MKKGQIGIEFILLIILAIVILMTGLIVINSLTTSKIDEKTYNELDDLGLSIQRELILITELEDGFRRTLNVPVKVNGRTYTIITNNTSPSVGYLLINYLDTEIYYAIPALNGTLKLGNNYITKHNGVITVE